MSQSSLEVFQNYLRRAMEETPRPILLLDRECRILQRTLGAERQLSAPLPLETHNGNLRVRDKDNAKQFAAFVENLGPHPQKLFLASKESNAWVLVRGRLASSGADRFILLDCSISYTLLSAEEAGLSQDFGLTKTEGVVLDSFARLCRPREIAEAMNVSVSTVRSHLKQIHTKMGVHSSTQLLALTRAYCNH